MSTPPSPSPTHGRRTTVIAAATGAAVVAGCAVLLTPGPATQSTAATSATATTTATATSADSPAPATAAASSDANTAGSAGAADLGQSTTAGVPSASASDSPSAAAIAIPHATSATSGAATLLVSADETVPGTLALSWPSQGQARIDVDGYGTLGSSGPVGTAQPIASVTKTMTAYLILRDHPLSPGQQGPNITITAADVTAYNYDVSQNMSTVPVQAGEVITEYEALEALMLPSANNMADILAHWDTGSTTDTAFVAEMNAAAATLGMTHTHYTDASGYDSGSVSTAPDLVLLARNAIFNRTFADIVAETSASIPVAGTIDNTNELLGYEGVDGIKTGSTDEAGGCLLFNADVTLEGRTVSLTGAVLGQDAPDGQELSVGLAAAKTLLSSAEAAITTRTLIPAGTAVASRTLADGTVQTYSTLQDVTVTAWPGEVVTLKLSNVMPTPALQVYASNGRLLGTAVLH